MQYERNTAVADLNLHPGPAFSARSSLNARRYRTVRIHHQDCSRGRASALE